MLKTLGYHAGPGHGDADGRARAARPAPACCSGLLAARLLTPLLLGSVPGVSGGGGHRAGRLGRCHRRRRLRRGTAGHGGPGLAGGPCLAGGGRALGAAARPPVEAGRHGDGGAAAARPRPRHQGGLPAKGVGGADHRRPGDADVHDHDRPRILVDDRRRAAPARRHRAGGERDRQSRAADARAGGQADQRGPASTSGVQLRACASACAWGDHHDHDARHGYLGAALSVPGRAGPALSRTGAGGRNPGAAGSSSHSTSASSSGCGSAGCRSRSRSSAGSSTRSTTGRCWPTAGIRSPTRVQPRRSASTAWC